MDQYIKLENPQFMPIEQPRVREVRVLHRPLNQHIRFNQVVRRNGATIKSILATFVIICYIYTCVHIIYFIYYIIYKLLQN